MVASEANRSCRADINTLIEARRKLATPSSNGRRRLGNAPSPWMESNRTSRTADRDRNAHRQHHGRTDGTEARARADSRPQCVLEELLAFAMPLDVNPIEFIIPYQEDRHLAVASRVSESN